MREDDPVITALREQRALHGKSVENGFPIVDNVYWRDPSPMVGGLFLMQLQKAKAMTGAAAIDLRPPARASRPLSSVVAELEREHQPGFWYRGQRMRRSCFYEGKVPRMEGAAPGINPVHVAIDALTPSSYRTYTRTTPANWSLFKLIPPLDNFAGPARAILASRERDLGELLLKAIDAMLFDAIRVANVGRARFGYDAAMLAQGSNVPQAMLDLISIAQHYDYGSIMVDVSTSIGAAAWFATRDWESGKVAGSNDGSPGVIYRFDAGKIAGYMDRHIAGPGAMPPPALHAFGVFGLADIASRFSFLDRPRLQRGGSLLGMENVVTHFLMLMNDAVEVFPFDHKSVTGRETAFGADDIRPEHDRGVEIFRPHDKFSTAPLGESELREFLSWMGMAGERINRLIELRQAGVF